MKADPADTSCVHLSQSTVPCPLEANGSFSYDTARLPDGAHTFQLLVTDIAGNVTASRKVEVTTANHPKPNGIAPSHTANLRARFAKGRKTAVVGYGKRKRIYGHLTAKNGKPIAGASVRIYGKQKRTGARTKLMKRVRTSATGHFAWTPPAGPSRTYTVAYRAYSTDLRDAARATLALGVKAGVTLKLSPHRLRNGSRMRIRGTLRGGPNRRGTIVTMQVLNPRKVSFLDLKVDRHGHFKGAYRFRNTHVRYTFRFRALVQRQPAYPYRAGISKTLHVMVLP